MQKFDLHVVSVPDHTAEKEVAKIIVKGNRTVSLHTAIEMTRNLPVVLCRGLDLKEAGEVTDHLKSHGIGFKLSKAEDAPAPDGAEAAQPQAKPTVTMPAAQAQPPTQQTAAAPAPSPPAQQAAKAAAPTAQPPQAAAAKAPAARAAEDDAIRSILQPAEPRPRSYNPGTVAGMRIGGISLASAKEAEERSRKNSIIIASVFAGVFIILGLVLLLLSKDSKVNIKKDDGLIQKVSAPKTKKQRQAAKSEKNTAAQTPKEPEAQNKDRQRAQVSGAQKQQASSLVDSAKTSDDMDRTIAFYKMAISFNRYNLAAWQGLLQAYRDTQKIPEARETEEQMREVFGEEVMSVNSVVKQFGDVTDAYKNDNGTYRLEYKTKKQSRDDILREIFNMTRAVRSACDCQTISIYASMGTGGKGMLVHSSPQTSIHTLSAFTGQVEIVWLE